MCSSSEVHLLSHFFFTLTSRTGGSYASSFLGCFLIQLSTPFSSFGGLFHPYLHYPPVRMMRVPSPPITCSEAWYKKSERNLLPLREVSNADRDNIKVHILSLCLIYPYAKKSLFDFLRTNKNHSRIYLSYYDLQPDSAIQKGPTVYELVAQ